ncbi:hypothetical protein DBR32_06825 [Taibaiella sp. KBW10]|nr:hypothetical protein DBR32_06825 [Taibaiella sp. KBW10]
MLLAQQVSAQSIQEKRVYALLDSLDNPYYTQRIPEDGWGRIPPEGYEEKYPFRMQLRALQNELSTLLRKDTLSVEVLRSLLKEENYQKLFSTDWHHIVDQITAYKDDAAHKQLLAFAILPSTTYSWQQTGLEQYTIRSFVVKQILPGDIKAYIFKNKDFNATYYNRIDKETDLLIIEAQISYLKAERKKEGLGDAPRWANLLFDKMISPIKYCDRDYPFYLDYGNYWDHHDNKKNVDMTIKILNEIKTNYESIHLKCKQMDKEIQAYQERQAR